MLVVCVCGNHKRRWVLNKEVLSIPRRGERDERLPHTCRFIHATNLSGVFQLGNFKRFVETGELLSKSN